MPTTFNCPTCSDLGWVLAGEYFEAAKAWPESDLLGTHQLQCPADCRRAETVRMGRASLGLPPMKCLPVVTAEFERDQAFMAFAQALAGAATSIALQHVSEAA